MQVKSFMLTLGLGMVAGAAAAAVLPRQPQVRQAVSKAADSVENAVEMAKDTICGPCCGCSGN